MSHRACTAFTDIWRAIGAWHRQAINSSNPCALWDKASAVDKAIEAYVAASAKSAAADSPFETVDGQTYLKHDRIDITARVNGPVEVQFYYGNKPTVLMHVVVAGQPVTLSGLEGRQGVTFS